MDSETFWVMNIFCQLEKRETEIQIRCILQISLKIIYNYIIYSNIDRSHESKIIWHIETFDSMRVYFYFIEALFEISSDSSVWIDVETFPTWQFSSLL